ncbi:MAG TPA: glycine cleavage system aminomethyltransferase GcvT [Ktedonobacteraceae bacterium]|nr:glycine cleavage system aminomethyltransferase GcvT [Ktedonobacteraceae bacterium]
MTDTTDTAAALKRTPLYAAHKALGARLVEFSGWEMPVQYSSIIDEHNAVRTHAGLFDVSHMGEFKASGSDALAFLQYLVPNDVAKLAIGQALYTQLCKPDAGVIDDLLIYHLSEHDYMLVVNAGNIETDYAWVEQQSKNFPDVQLANQSDATALLALQGPLAQSILQPLTEVELASIRYYHFEAGLVDGVNCIISRTGYTGEDGFELYFAPVDAPKLWNELLAVGKPQGLLPVGLGARDTLRLEAGYCLYGHELNEQTNPLEAGLGWTVKLNKGNFIGRDALVQIKEQGVERKLIGVEMIERGVCRSEYVIYDNEHPIGSLTSGAPSPTLHKNIGMGYAVAAHARIGEEVAIDIRGKKVAARIVAVPFYKRKK